MLGMNDSIVKELLEGAADNFVIISHRFFRLFSVVFLVDVKEFVHGDLGRTVPSVASLLGCQADILQLDCRGIEL